MAIFHYVSHYQRIYPIHNPLNHYKVSLNLIKSPLNHHYMVLIWIFPWCPRRARGGSDRPMEGRNDLDIDPGCLAKKSLGALWRHEQCSVASCDPEIISIFCNIYMIFTGWWWLEHFLFFIYWESSSQLTFIFFRGVETTNQWYMIGQEFLCTNRPNFLAAMVGRTGDFFVVICDDFGHQRSFWSMSELLEVSFRQPDSSLLSWRPLVCFGHRIAVYPVVYLVFFFPIDFHDGTFWIVDDSGIA